MLKIEMSLITDTKGNAVKWILWDDEEVQDVGVVTSPRLSAEDLFLTAVGDIFHGVTS